ncbi:hypothetical protein SPRG_16921 [Saprolegnia parasitica CBS 223.65]|uniref:Uncharacterized protein n=1 Tax=Saprolegnia parasitica (strain CBS 223.65) TaxID=695850 RepID=A0A067BGK5_SAPPC|nr:hypothetical protein SPRG_16921 [Saprolegnia parasitica CBS 223.65]KDO17534.1 hypothetical protein SPRG_16921 [Saprolegnia parasitica CBS 223.65]|eukprot:XP_012211759.1 hypothetical protein SPRG_16921 [Saprolegnia parasitica CBS 223.65]
MLTRAPTHDVLTLAHGSRRGDCCQRNDKFAPQRACRSTKCLLELPTSPSVGTSSGCAPLVHGANASLAPTSFVKPWAVWVPEANEVLTLPRLVVASVCDLAKNMCALIVPGLDDFREAVESTPLTLTPWSTRHTAEGVHCSSLQCAVSAMVARESALGTVSVGELLLSETTRPTLSLLRLQTTRAVLCYHGYRQLKSMDRWQ